MIGAGSVCGLPPATPALLACFPAPGRALAPPVLRHPERIPPAVRAVMGRWTQHWFPGRDIRVRLLRDVFVAAEGLVLCADGTPVPETVDVHRPDQLAEAQAALSAAVPRLAGTVVLCRKPGAQNYGHWLTEMLPRALFASPPARVLVQEAPAALGQVMRDGLALMGYGPADIVAAGEAPVRVERLLLVDGLAAHGNYLSPIVPELLEHITWRIPKLPTGWIFVTRAGPRTLAGQDRIADRLARAGFNIVDPGRMAFDHQVAVFRGATRVVGVMGAGMANIVFSPPGTEIVLLAPAGMPDIFFWLIAGLRRQPLLEIRCTQAGPQRGPMPWDAALDLDEADLQRILDPTPLPPPESLDWVEPGLARHFDAGFYRAQNPDVAAAGVDPLRHFLEIGWREGRNPSARFNTSAALAADAALRAADINPLIHAMLQARNAGREMA